MGPNKNKSSKMVGENRSIQRKIGFFKVSRVFEGVYSRVVGWGGGERQILNFLGVLV